jgi:glycerol-3-phosphate acyltransferase PlsY
MGRVGEMSGTGVLWAAGGYLAGTFPSAWIIARAKRSSAILDAARRSSGETDPHILMAKHLGVGWTVVAATLDVVKAFVFVLAARHWGGLDSSWLALSGVTVVIGHSFPFYLKEMAGRGLAAASGVLLLLLPIPMTVCGLLIVVGGVLRNTSLATTIGLASVPMVAAIQGQPGAFVAMGATLFVLIMLRRLEGVGTVIRTGVGPARALWYRMVFDSSGPPPGRGVWDRGGEHVPPS